MTKPGGNGKKILFDISTSMRWTGPPTGIVRVEQEFALWAAGHVSNVTFVFFDPTDLVYKNVVVDAHQFLLSDATLDAFSLTSAAKPEERRTDRVPAAFRRAFLWCTQTRRMALQKFEVMRLKSRSPRFAALLDGAQRLLMSKKYRAIMVRDDGTRRPFYPYHLAIGDPVNFQPDDALICVGAGWSHTNINAISELKSRSGFRLVLLCHDLIPVIFPEFYPQRDVRNFIDYMKRALATADLIAVNSHAVEADCRNFCRAQGIEPKEIAVGFLGADIRSDKAQATGPLPAPLVSGRFVLLVSTIEPRKGHLLLSRAWRRLLADGIPQAKGFKLVFVGRLGWMMDDFINSMRSDVGRAEHIVILPEVSDQTLASLYHHAAFCAYPSRYEGYGLPVVEAFLHHKAVLVSSGGALPELTRGFSPSLNPDDENAWYLALKSWLLDPAEYQAYAQQLRDRFQHPSWDAAAKRFFETFSEHC